MGIELGKPLSSRVVAGVCFSHRYRGLTTIFIDKPNSTESAYTLHADVIEKLLKRCTSVKTVRLCLRFGRELSLPWASKLTPARLPTGSNRPWVSRSKEGLLVLKP